MAENHKKIVLTVKRNLKFLKTLQCRIGDKISRRLQGTNLVTASMKQCYWVDLTDLADENNQGGLWERQLC
jgi:hypothetical protein